MPRLSGHSFQSGKPLNPYTEDRIKWNQEWETEIAWNLSGSVPKPIDVLRGAFLYLSTEVEMQDVLAEHRETYGLLCRSLTHLAQAVTICYATRDFLNRWRSAAASVREEHILEGLVRSCGRSHSEFFRLLCDELTLPFLQRDRGQGFLDLLKNFTLDDFSQVPKTPIYLESRHWHAADPSAEPREVYELADAEFNLHRSWLIGFTLHETLRSFHGIPDIQPSLRQRSSAKSRLPQITQKFLEYAHGPAAAKEMHRKSVQEQKAYPLVAVCDNCRKHETPGAQRFMRCKPCIENVARRVYYCSRQCQREDWKFRHKRICGKAMTLKESEETACISPTPATPSATLTPKISPPINGFKRSPALAYQVNLLNENITAGTDYILITRTQRVFRLKVDDDNEKRAFRTFRDAALTTGDESSVAAIGQFLVKPPGGAVAMFDSPTAALGGPIVQLGMDKQDAFDQLEREYGFDVAATVATLERRRGNGLTELEKEVLTQDYPSW
ncbi:hypothetical protein B0H17DRAFT_1053144 [Mycena rosella]|uniref:MYND-type domain-containing protein n=1 Tax=Mycena rosella TaxID=1033263 RepID=A0AAD7GP20_MYCRO|nr:hypothetical protein B0H17DRAFT_1053144 [Mycena rosella]